MNNDYVITPDSDIYLLKCPLEIDSLNQLDFNDKDSQHSYFNSLPKILMDDATYVRRESRIYFEGTYDELCTYNYCMYRNNNFSNKWFYAFISDMRYESNNSISADLTTDVFQTWMFDVTFKQSFVERMMPAKQYDIAGNYTYPEGLETGDYISNNVQEVTELKSQCIVVGTTADYTDLNDSVTGIYQNIPCGCGYYFAPLTTTGITYVQGFLQDLTDATKQDAIVSLFLAPSFLCTYASGQSGDLKKINNSTSASILDITLTNNVAGLDGYVPHNNKLYTYPYYYTLVTNGAGGSSIIKPELWDTATHKFRVIASLTPGCSIIGLPLDYAGKSVNYEESLPLGKYPQLNYSTDQYVNWQTQNGLNNTMQEVNGVLNSIVGGAKFTMGMGNVAGGGNFTDESGNIVEGGSQYLGGLQQITNAIYQRYLASLIPAQFRGNANSGDAWSSASQITYRFNYMSIRSEFARAIDHYFDMFGYKVAGIRGINTKTRSNWNYIKTIDVNILGNIPQADMQRLKALYNNGFTIWHKPAYFMDYSQSNN